MFTGAMTYNLNRFRFQKTQEPAYNTHSVSQHIQDTTCELTDEKSCGHFCNVT